jgi:hypothetical protein
VRGLNQVEGGAALADVDAVAGFEPVADLPVERERDLLLRRLEHELDLGVVRHDERAVRERVRADGRDDDGVHRGVHDGAAGREVVGGRTRRRRDDQPVGAEAVDELPVEPRVDLDDARQGRLRDDHVVEHTVAQELLVAAPQLGGEHDAAVEAEVAGEDRVERRGHLFEAHLGEVAEAAEVDADDGD